ncbi:hypothetical protein ATE84_2888 [Aquimarina sp. MAR_2010_214]|uniref:hypothetical protein n=1 Tax=Aquimarina sp. MAR_2010_214 TaxID=1250026 RepID=UPI000C703513|nr:hypothetical protein [Aquimarina sp. MAR_2010_214]PKV50821.1 hypothetical protein ATE84_2888 [Aquimarina sp. MAR_2010_214]
MEALKLNEKKHLDEAALNFTDNRVLGAIFIIAQVGFVFLRRNFGVRILKVEMILFAWSGLMLIAALADWITDLPLLGATLDYASFRLFAIIYLVRAIYHTVRAYLNAKQIPHRYTRHLGDSYIFDVISKLEMPFFKKSRLRINAFAEPIAMFFIAEIVKRTIAPNLGIFLMIVAVCMLVVGILVINNHNKMRWDQNDSMVLGNLTQKNMKDAKPSAKKNTVSRASRAPLSRKQDRNHPSS